METQAKTTPMPKKRGLRALMGAGALIAIGFIVALCVLSLTIPREVSKAAQDGADALAPVDFLFSYSVAEGQSEIPTRKEVVVSSGLFVREDGRVRDVKGLWYDVDWADEQADFSLERLPKERQDASKWNANRFAFRFLLVLPWAVAGLLLLGVFSAIGRIIGRDLKTLEAVAQAIEEDKRRARG